ncbi:hypothetical protein ABIB25_005585 [Nakamurella sp. UYEF19]|uniref:phospholipase D family protein n=1 Tax=Nakamurella sp. UYEF19 TaxID=1756392 RepID=UPI00339B94F6
MAILATVRKASEQVDLFCQAGCITVPQQASALMAFLEPMVHTVRATRPGHLFHPKVWFLKYRNGSDVKYRLLIQSRNLTPDACWDAVVSVDGDAGTRPQAANRPLVELLRSLPGLTTTTLPAGRSARIREFAEDLRRVNWELPADATDMMFHVWGLPGTQPAVDFTGSRHLVVSPFLTDNGLAIVAPTTRDLTLVSRVESLEGLTEESLKRASRRTIFDPNADLNVDDPEDENEGRTGLLSGLHAKIYAVERANQAHLFIGSANATEFAFGGNVEILVEFVGRWKTFGVDALLGAEGLGHLLQDYDPPGGRAPDANDEAQRRLDEIVRGIASLDWQIHVKAGEANRYELTARTASLANLPDGYWGSLELLTRPGYSCDLAGNEHLLYTEVELADISAFLVLRVTSPEGLVGGAVIPATLIGDPHGRLDEILARQLDTPEKFLQFLRMLLSLNDPSASGWMLGEGDGGGSFASSSGGILESVLRAMAVNPRALDDLDALILNLQNDPERRHVLPPGLAELWPAVRAARDMLAKDAP